MQRIYAVMFAIVTFVACQPFRLTRVGYENLRQVQDTSCAIRIIEPGAGIPVGEKIGRMEIAPRIGKKNRQKANALAVAKMDACAINATTLYIVQEHYNNDDPTKAYSCIIDLYRDTRKAETIPDFVKRAQAEAREAKEQRDRMNELKGKMNDSVAEVIPEKTINIDSIATTSLHRYKSADSLTHLPAADTAQKLDIQAVRDTAHHFTPVPTPAPAKEKLKKGIFATIGHHYGGATIAGMELEAAVWRIGIMGGAGVYGYCYGINYHVSPDPLSSYVSCLYWQNGISEYARQSVVGATYNYRGKRWLSMQLGLGKIIDKGPEFNYFNNNFILLYSIGAYVPF